MLNTTSGAQTLRATINKWDLLKVRSIKAKDTVSKTKRQPIEWEKIFTNPTSDKGLISKIYKELNKLDNKILNNPIKMGYKIKQKILDRGISNGQKIIKEMFNIFNHQRNVNHLREWNS